MMLLSGDILYSGSFFLFSVVWHSMVLHGMERRYIPKGRRILLHTPESGFLYELKIENAL